MRLIDADAAIEYLREHKRQRSTLNFGLNANEDAVIKFVETKCPTVEAAPVVHGEWLHVPLNADPNYPFYKYMLRKRCSVCLFTMPEEYPNYHICPNCGAKMDGGTHE